MPGLHLYSIHSQEDEFICVPTPKYIYVYSQPTTTHLYFSELILFSSPEQQAVQFTGAVMRCKRTSFLLHLWIKNGSFVFLEIFFLPQVRKNCLPVPKNWLFPSPFHLFLCFFFLPTLYIYVCTFMLKNWGEKTREIDAVVAR